MQNSFKQDYLPKKYYFRYAYNIRQFISEIVKEKFEPTSAGHAFR